MKVLLTTLNAKYIHLNLAIRLLYQLNQHREGLAWREFTIKENKYDIARYCANFEIIAFSCYIWNISQTLAVCEVIKNINPNIKILLGGPEVSYDWEDVICRPEVDFIITGEGEIPFQQFLENYPNVEKVPNLVRKVGTEIMTLPLGGIFDLKNYENMNFYKNDPPEELRNKVLYIETSRGCPYKCEFCLASLDNKVRYLPTDTLKDNLLYLMKNGRVIKFLDRTFNIKRDFTISIFEFILAHHRPENVFQFEITADILHPEIIRFIHERVPKGLFRFEIGIQTVNQKANLAVSRKQNFEKTKAIVQELSYKVEMHLDLIVGLALDYWDDIKYSFEEVFKLFAPELQLGFLKFLKGTPVRHKAEQHGFIYDPNPPYQIIESNYLTRNELHQIEILENALEIYWNKNRTHLTLKYVTATYSIFDFLLGLGNHFLKTKEFHKYDLQDVYEIIHDFVKTHYPNDAILQELIGIDYYMYHKLKPKPLFLAEIPLVEKRLLLQRIGADLQKFRYLVFPITFDFEQLTEGGIFSKKDNLLIIRYNGISKCYIMTKEATTLTKLATLPM